MGLCLVGQLVKNPPATQETKISIPGEGGSSGEGNSNTLQYFCLENLRDREARQVTIHGVVKETQFSN